MVLENVLMIFKVRRRNFEIWDVLHFIRLYFVAFVGNRVPRAE